MSVRFSTTTSDFLQWADMTNLVRNLFDDGKPTLSLLVACGCFFGLRISDLLSLRWSHLLNKDSFEITEKKTGKRRTIRVNQQLQKHIKACHRVIAPASTDMPCFVSQKGTIYSIQRLNTILKELKYRYRLNIDNISTHTLRKTFGRRVYDQAGTNSEHALVMLSEIFNHINTTITRKYLGIKQQDIFQIYDSLGF